MTTNFQKVTHFNKTFGAVVHESPQTDLYVKNPDLVKLRIALIDEEVRELKEACENHDLVETVDALADILYVVYGAFNAFGIDGDKAFDLVHESNMTKLCNNEKEAQESVEAYKNDPRYRETNYKALDDGTGKYMVYDVDSGKVLKSKYYQAVDLKPLCNN